ncbi:hypothetical protein NO2_0076 [Candidatus Termititenax persephonae]|uniref:Uncharacterized protein n=1 Tax=Candidatus Termititenax persephonae TaxID=2218525 RepID=A0A388TGM8_9BACT|nr:hypothetical protein NO2_0076 [Candidatus Termititenax persephonae]
MSDLNINRLDKSYIIRTDKAAVQSGSSAVSMPNAIRLAGEAFRISRKSGTLTRSEITDIKQRITALSSMIYQLLPKDDKYKKDNGVSAADNERLLAEYLDATTWDAGPEHNYKSLLINNEDVPADERENLPDLDIPTYRLIYAYGHLNMLIQGAEENDRGPVDNSARAAAYRTNTVTAANMSKYNYETLLDTAESLIQQDNTNLTQVEELLLFAIHGESYKVGADRAKNIFGLQSYGSQYMDGYPGVADDRRAYDLLEQLIELPVIIADDIFADQRTVQAAPTVDTNKDGTINTHDAYAASTSQIADNPNWTNRAAEQTFNADRLIQAWDYYTQAEERLARIRTALPSAAGRNVQQAALARKLDDYTREITAKKNNLLQRLLTEAQKLNPYPAYTLLDTVRKLSGADNLATKTASAAIKTEQKNLLNAAKTFYGTAMPPSGIRLDLVPLRDSLGASQQNDVDNAWQVLNSEAFKRQKELFDAYYAGRITDENGQKYAQATALLRNLNISSADSVSDAWQSILAAKQSKISEDIRAAEEAAVGQKNANLSRLERARQNFAEAQRLYELTGTPAASAAGVAAAAANVGTDKPDSKEYNASNLLAARAEAEKAAEAAGLTPSRDIANYSRLSDAEKTEAIATKVLEKAEKNIAPTQQALSTASQAFTEAATTLKNLPDSTAAENSSAAAKAAKFGTDAGSKVDGADKPLNMENLEEAWTAAQTAARTSGLPENARNAIIDDSQLSTAGKIEQLAKKTKEHASARTTAAALAKQKKEAAERQATIATQKNDNAQTAAQNGDLQKTLEAYQDAAAAANQAERDAGNTTQTQDLADTARQAAALANTTAANQAYTDAKESAEAARSNANQAETTLKRLDEEIRQRYGFSAIDGDPAFTDRVADTLRQIEEHQGKEASVKGLGTGSGFPRKQGMNLLIPPKVNRPESR